MGVWLGLYGIDGKPRTDRSNNCGLANERRVRQDGTRIDPTGLVERSAGDMRKNGPFSRTLCLH